MTILAAEHTTQARLPDKPMAVDLFAGVGGMSLGFRAAGFDVVGAVELDPLNVAEYNRNFGEGSAAQGDLSALTGDEIRELFRLHGQNIDLVFGGPPCQGFSVGGTRTSGDPRNELLGHFGRLVLELQPRAFVAENVEGLTTARMSAYLEDFVDNLRDGGYSVAEPTVLNAADFGVPQKRRRVFIAGVRNSETPIELPQPSGREVTVADAIGDLPRVDDRDDLLESDVVYDWHGRRGSYAIRLDHEFAPVRKPGKPRVLTGCGRTNHSATAANRFASTKPGTADPVSRFFRLALDGQARTLRAGTDSSRGSHTAPRPIHPTEPRVITVREAARLHSYPDWFSFNAAKWHAFRQIGNSVPPLLAKAVAASVAQALKCREEPWPR